MSILEGGQDLNDLGQTGDFGDNNVIFFANFVNYGGKRQSLFFENSVTFLYIEKSSLLRGLAFELDIKPSIIAHNHSFNGNEMKLKSRTSFIIFAIENLQKEFKKSAIFYTKNEPLDPEKFRNGEQEVYVSQSTIPAEINEALNDSNSLKSQILKKLQEEHNETLYTLVDIKDINNVKNSLVYFTNQKPIKNPTKLTIKYDPSFALHRIFAKGFVNQKFTNINLKILNNLFAIVKMAPVGIESKLFVKMDSLDYNLTMPYAFLKEWKGITKGLKDKIAITNSSGQKAFNELWTLFKALFELTYAYSTNFSDYLITVDGRSFIDPNVKIGGKKIGLLGNVTSGNALNSISGWIEEWKIKHPNYIDSVPFRIFRAAVYMLSEYLQCNLAIGGGLNEMHKVDQIFYFELRDGINKGFSGGSSKLLVQVKSLFFDIDVQTGELALKDQFKNVSESQVFNLNEVVNLAQMPDKIAETTLFAGPQNKSIEDGEVSKYYVLVPVDDQKSLQSIYGNIKQEINNATKTKEVIKTFNFSYDVFHRQTIVQKEGIHHDGSTPPSPPKLPTPNLDAHDIYVIDLSERLAESDKVKEVDGHYDIKNIKYVYLGTTNYKKVLIDFQDTGIVPTSTYEYYYKDVYTITYDVVLLEEETSSNDIVFVEQQKVFDQQQFSNWIKKYCSKNKIELKLDMHYVNPNGTINQIHQIALQGFFGHTFDIEIANDNNEKLELKDLNFFADFDESMSITKINF